MSYHRSNHSLSLSASSQGRLRPSAPQVTHLPPQTNVSLKAAAPQQQNEALSARKPWGRTSNQPLQQDVGPGFQALKSPLQIP